LPAAERTGRCCRGVELDPLYIDVIIRRYHSETGQSAVLEETGETAHLFANPWPTTLRTGRASHAMPTHNRLGPDDGYGVKNARKAPIEPNEQRTVGPQQMQSAWGALPQEIELMQQHQDFGF
jgi:hypothetical protein